MHANNPFYHARTKHSEIDAPSFAWFDLEREYYNIKLKKVLFTLRCLGGGFSFMSLAPFGG